MFKVWRCFTETILKKYIIKKSFPLRSYVVNYVSLFRKNNLALRKIQKSPKNKNLRKKSSKKSHRKTVKKA